MKKRCCVHTYLDDHQTGSSTLELSVCQAACDWRLAVSATSVSSSTRSGAEVRTPCASKCVRQATKPLSRSAVSSASNRGGSIRCARQRWATFQYKAGARASSCEGTQRVEDLLRRRGGLGTPRRMTVTEGNC